MLNSKEETTDLIFRRMASQVKVIRELDPKPAMDDYKSSVVEACERIIRMMECQQGGHKMAQLRRKL